MLSSSTLSFTIHQPFYLSSIHQLFPPSTHLSIHPLSINLFIYQSLHPFITHSSIHLLFIHPLPIPPSIYPSIDNLCMQTSLKVQRRVTVNQKGSFLIFCPEIHKKIHLILMCNTIAHCTLYLEHYTNYLSKKTNTKVF